MSVVTAFIVASAVVQAQSNQAASQTASQAASQDAMRNAIENQDELALALLLDDYAALNSLSLTRLFSDKKEAAIHLAARGKSVAILNLIIAAGGDPTLADEQGDRALHIAVSRGNVAIVSRLIEQGVDLDSLNDSAETALQIAQESGLGLIQNLLIEAGALNTQLSVENRRFVGKELIQNQTKNQFTHFTVSADGRWIATVENNFASSASAVGKQRITLLNQHSQQLTFRDDWDKDVISIAFYQDQLVVFHSEGFDFLSIDNLGRVSQHKTVVKPAIHLLDESRNRIIYSDTWSVYEKTIDLNAAGVSANNLEDKHLFDTLGAEQLVASQSGKTIFVCSSFVVEVRDAESFVERGRYDVGATNWVAVGENLVSLLFRDSGSSETFQGNRFSVISDQAVLVDTFLIEQSFQLFDATMRSLGDKHFLIESFGELISISLDGGGFQFSPGDFKFSDFEFRRNLGFILFNPNEIRIVSQTGPVLSRMLPEMPAREISSERVLVKGADVYSLLKGKQKLLDSSLEGVQVSSVSVNGNLIAAGYVNGSYALWNGVSGKLLKEKENYLRGKISAVVIDPTLRRLYLGGFGRIGIIEFDEENVDEMLRGHEGNVSTLSLTADRRLLISTANDQSVKFWDTQQLHLVDTLLLEQGWLNTVSIDSKNVVVASGPGVDAFKLDATGILEAVSEPATSVAIQISNTSAVSKLVFDETNRLMANKNGSSINVWDVKTGLLQTRLFPSIEIANDLTFSSEGRSLIVGGGSELEYWDPLTGKLQKRLDLSVAGAAYHELNAIGGLGLFIGSNIHGWHDPHLVHTNSGEVVGRLNFSEQIGDREDATVDIQVSNSGAKIAVFGSKNIHIFIRQGNSYQLTLSLPRDKPGVTNNYWRNYIGFSDDEKYINYISFEDGNHTVIHDIELDQEVFRAAGKLSVFLDKHRFAYVYPNTGLMLHDLETGEEKSIATDHMDLISSLSYNEKEDVLFSIDIWGNTFSWIGRTGKQFRSNLRFDSDLYVAETSSNSRFIAYTNKQGLHLLDLRTMQHIAVEGSNYPYFGAFSHNAKYFYYRNRSEYWRMDLDSMQTVVLFETAFEKQMDISGTMISHDNRYLSYSIDKVLSVHDLQTGNKVVEVSRSNIQGEGSSFLPHRIDVEDDTMIGYLLRPAGKGAATNQLTQYDYKTGEFKPLHDSLRYDMSDEINRYTAQADLAINAVSKNSRYYAYSIDRHLRVVDLENGELLFDSYRNNLVRVLFDEKEQLLLLASEGGYIEKISLQDKKVVSRYKAVEASITSMKIAGDVLQVMSDNEVVTLFDVYSDKQIVSILPRGTEDFMILEPNGYYYATKDAAQMGIAFRKGVQMYPFEQFDVQFNRPDKVFDVLLARGIVEPSLVTAYRKAYEKRLDRLGYSAEEGNRSEKIDQPLLVIESESIPIATDKEFVEVPYQLRGKQAQDLHVWINGVPLYGRNGLALSTRNTNKRKISGETVREGSVRIPLGAGENRIQLSARTNTGIESLRQMADVYSSREAVSKLHLVMIGASEYKAFDRNLDYAAKDAQDVAKLLSENHVQGDTVLHLLQNESVTAQNVRDLKEALMSTSVDDQVIVFYAGHGMLDEQLDYYLGTFDVDFESPQKNGLSYETLEYLFDGIPARNRLMLIDACHSGEADKSELQDARLALASNEQSGLIVKLSKSAESRLGTGDLGVNNLAGNVNARGLDAFDDEIDEVESSGPRLGLQASFDLSKQLFSDIRKDAGVTVISASGSAEFALETDDLGNGVFTYSVIEGLKTGKADLNDDGDVSISELQSYVKASVLELTNGKQQPTFRVENISNDWSVYSLGNN